ncbi:DNA-3-methyladenine glycosylase [Amycolatopsis sp. FDAARGOS 1241]|uniref:DNA-3-methyladenine glycosylase family protein n=1 Tax=Amycolatopsis sp. FDAARGOS 1241 TaxID=2778070 RepID=UPI00194F550C|nr:DNA-3-methyladenine glycosylase 2 family protein [Amycolatopsis sp. FDAARGOS 1241]QRP47797.1 DNA-3-methyladenine glycosylase 2 family protein [Amycolatopsis sp. FDAARGOS 1241]
MTPEEHLRQADEVLGRVMDDITGTPPKLPPDPDSSGDPDIPKDSYGVLVRAIVSQNISIHASRSIFRKLKDRFGGRLPTPEELLADDSEELRQAAGLSRAKTVSLRSLADCLLSGALDLDELRGVPDDEVIAKLDVVKGIGVWTADMFLMFHLHRPDVLPTGDLELRRIVQKVYGLAAAPTPAELTRLAEPWRPYRTLACLYLWQLAEQAPRL